MPVFLGAHAGRPAVEGSMKKKLHRKLRQGVLNTALCLLCAAAIPGFLNVAFL